MSWKKTITEAPAASWRDTVQTEKEEPGLINTAITKAGEGFTLGFDDEIAGGLSALGRVAGVKGLGGRLDQIGLAEDGPTLDMDTISDEYTQTRDDIRKTKGEMQEAHPVLSATAGIVGSMALPGSAAKTFGGRLATAGAMGSVAGAGNSDEDSALGVGKDMLVGAGLGVGFQGLGEKVIAPAIQKTGSFTDKIMQAAAKKSPTANRLASKIAGFTSGVDEDAALRQIERPLQTAAAQSDDFAFKMGQQAVHDTETLGTTLGTNVKAARNQFLNSSGSQVMPETEILKKQVAEFIVANEPSARGFTGISKAQREDLMTLKEMLDGPLTGEDLVKVRDYLDHVKRLAGKYDQEGTGPFIGFLKGLRGTADNILDTVAPDINSANNAFAQYKADTGLLRGATNAGQAESMISNLYGANKGAQQEAAGRLLMPDTFDAAKDIAANKAFANAKGPAGSEFGLRRMAGLALAPFTGGLSVAATSPETWQKGLRSMGRLEQAIKTNPQMFGKYSQVLSEALNRGPQSLAATHFILSQRDAQYRDTMKTLEKDDEK